MSLFDFADYKAFARDWVARRPRGGRGEYRRMAQHLGVSSTMISQVFNGEKDLSLEMAAELSGFFGLNAREERYLFLLVEFSRAGSKRLRDALEKQIDEFREAARKVIERVQRDKELSHEDKAIYYSSWTFTGVRNLVAIPYAWSNAEIAARLQLPESQVREVLAFLIDRGLVSLDAGRFEVVAKATHLSADNPLVIKHHQNWRIRGFQKMDQRDPADLHYTGPMSLAVADVEKVRTLLLDFIARVNALVVESPSETVRCLNVDWFAY